MYKTFQQHLSIARFAQVARIDFGPIVELGRFEANATDAVRMQQNRSQSEPVRLLQFCEHLFEHLGQDTSTVYL